MTEPAVGASTCASGSQVCTGHIGIFTAKEAKNASHSHFCIADGKLVLSRWHDVRRARHAQHIAIMASSISSEPSSV